MSKESVGPDSRKLRSFDVIKRTRFEADERFKEHGKRASVFYQRHRRFGIAVVVISAIVSTSIFGALLQQGLPLYVQVSAGCLSILATVLSAMQSFFDYSNLAIRHNETSIKFRDLKRRIDRFLQRYIDTPLDDAEYDKVLEEEHKIENEFMETSEQAPILAGLASRHSGSYSYRYTPPTSPSAPQ